MHEEAHVAGVSGRPAKLIEREGILSPGVCVPASMELDGGDPQVLGGIERAEIGIEEQADSDATLIQLADGVSDPGMRAAQIKTPLGGDLLTSFWDQCGLVGAKPAGKGAQVRAGGELEIEQRNGGAQPLDVAVLNMPTIFPKVRGEAVGPGLLAEQRGRDRIRLV